MRASLLARLLSGLQPDRRSVQQDQGYGAPSRSAHEGGFGGGVGRSAFGAQRSGRSRVFRACWLLSTSPITVKRAEGIEPYPCLRSHWAANLLTTSPRAAEGSAPDPALLPPSRGSYFKKSSRLPLSLL